MIIGSIVIFLLLYTFLVYFFTSTLKFMVKGYYFQNSFACIIKFHTTFSITMYSRVLVNSMAM